MDTNNFKILLETTLFPLMDFKKNQYDGLMLNIHPYCKSCDKECLIKGQGKDYKVSLCSDNILFFKISINNRSFIIHSLRNDYSILNRQDKKKYPNKIFFKHIEKVKKWVDKIEEIIQLDTKKKNIINLNNSVFIHDMKKVYSTILRRMEDYISENSTSSYHYDENLRFLDTNLLCIYKAINLLDYQFNNVNYISNPNAVQYGQLRETHIYKAIDKLNRILRTNSKIKIELKGTSHNQLFLYESFISLPFILIDNALKYSLKDQSIEIHINDLDDKVLIEIISFSPKINSEDKKHIFEKFQRGDNVCTLVPEGQGIGLYLAKVIADAHNIEIKLEEKNGTTTTIDDVLYCENIFKFIVQSLQ
ncbi:MAG: sensor histidine kinase [Candidatus Marinarcus sp.]|uniref:sensor histidine kinase n=1 Tax=Candidatus Marinarcus sp. TaxID=3100987 RepID=UPI003B00196B